MERWLFVRHYGENGGGGGDEPDFLLLMRKIKLCRELMFNLGRNSQDRGCPTVNPTTVPYPYGTDFAIFHTHSPT